MIEITEKPILPAQVIESVISKTSGSVITYFGIIRDNSQGKQINSVQLQDPKGKAQFLLKQIADEAKIKWQVENIAIMRRTGRIFPGEINHVVAVAAIHHDNSFAACRYIVDEFKIRSPLNKVELYQNGMGI